MRAALPLIALSLAGTAHADEVARRALVVGANDGGVGVDVLRYAEADAGRVAELLGELGGFSDDEVVRLSGPSADELAEALGRVGDDLDADGDSLFVFYYSGHADARGLRLGDDVLTWDALRAHIRGVPADVQLGILDACRSGAITRIKGAHVEAPFLVDPGLAAEGEAWIAASAEDEDAQESDWLEGSFFTHYLLSGLRGAADNGDGQVSLDEAYKYAYDRTVARTAGTRAGTQHPAYDFRLQGNGDLVLTEVRRATAHVTFPVDGAGEITVLREPHHSPVAEVAKVEGRAVTLALEPGRYLVRRRDGGTLSDVRVSLSEGSSMTVHEWGDPVDAELASRKGAPGLPTVTDDGDAISIRIPKRLSLPNDLSVDLSPRAGLAGAASAALPGAGQVWEGRFGAAAGFFLASTVLSGAGWGAGAVTHGPTTFTAPTGPNPFTLAGMGIYGWGIADAAWGAKRREDFRPRRGVTLALGTAWHDHPGQPWASGLAVDWIVVPGLSVGLDHSGVVQRGPGNLALRTGARVTAGPELDRLRPAAFVALGAEWTGLEQATSPDQLARRPLIAGGVNLRWYGTPRWFFRYEGRVEHDGDVTRLTNGLGFGVHVGRHERAPREATPLFSRKP